MESTIGISDVERQVEGHRSRESWQNADAIPGLTEAVPEAG